MAEGSIGRTGSESETNHIYSSLYSIHSQNHVESLSLEISTLLTKLGYGEEIRRWRVENYKERDRVHNAGQNAVTTITAISKAEGLTCVFESDTDILFVLNSVLCVESRINFYTSPVDIHLFMMDTRVYPGYCTLLQERRSHNCFKVIHHALCENGNGDIFLSSSLLVNKFSELTSNMSVDMVQHERAGPAIPETFMGVDHTDKVIGLRCHCPSILQRWAARPRHWPSPVIVQKVISLGAYVTPVGFKGSEYNHMEWRICFNTGEAELVNTLNDTQVKVYVMLRMILKEIIKPNIKEITTYMLKNIILWQAENNPQKKFHTRSFFHWLHDGLRELRAAIEKKQLRYYMIPERNLMAVCGLEDALQSKWITDITDMMEEGPRVILRLEKIRKAILASPEPMLWFCKTKIELEMLQLEMTNIVRQKQIQNENRVTYSDFILNAIKRRQLKILRELGLRMRFEGSSVNELDIRILF